jgi:hypothetical protein
LCDGAAVGFFKLEIVLSYGHEAAQVVGPSAASKCASGRPQGPGRSEDRRGGRQRRSRAKCSKQ